MRKRRTSDPEHRRRRHTVLRRLRGNPGQLNKHHQAGRATGTQLPGAAPRIVGFLDMTKVAPTIRAEGSSA